MINFLKKFSLSTGGLTIPLMLLFLVSPPVIPSAHGASGKQAPRYKKNTVVDFEGALVEGKSRKPYSTYLTQQRENDLGDLNRWEPDYGKSFESSKTKLEERL